MKKMERLELFKGNINHVDKEGVERALNNHKLQLCHLQENAELDWKRRLADYEKQIYSTEPDGVGQVIEKMIRDHIQHSEGQFSRFNVQYKPFFLIESEKRKLEDNNIQRSRKVSLECKSECIAEFNRKIGTIMSLEITVPEKYGKLKHELETCLHQYYTKLPWPLNDQTFDTVDRALQQIYDQVMQNLYTPEVREQLKRERVAQMEATTRISFRDNESLLWVFCVGCQRIFAGRTRGCINVTCCHFATQNGVANIDHGCGLAFEWTKAQPVPIATLPRELWLSNVEDQQSAHAENIIADVRHGLRRIYSVTGGAPES